MFPSPFARLFGMVSAPFDNEQYRNQQRKAIQRRTVIRKLSFTLHRFFLCLLRRNFCAAGWDASLVTAVRFSNGQEALSIDYSSAKYTRFPPKIAAAQRALFRVVESGGFLNRLRNVDLEKSAVTGIFRA